MPVQLTEEQRLAVTLEDNIAVTAGAGTGKTSAMTERVVRVLDGLERIDQLLVVTFTEDAAGEIRRRVYQALLTRIRGSAGADRARMEAMRDRFLQNHISTMHAFFARLLRRFPDRLAGVDPDFRVISGAEQQDLLRVSVEAVIDGVASAGDGPLSDDLRTWLRQHRRAGVCACVSAVIRKRIEVAEWLRHMTEGDSGEDYVTQERAARDFLARARGAFFGDERVRAMVEALRAAAPVSAAAEDALTRRRETVLNAVADEDVAALCVELLTKAGAPSTRRLGSKGAWDEDAGDAARGALFAIADMLVADPTLSLEWDDAVEGDAHEALCALARLTVDCLREYRGRKERMATLDFVDLEDLAATVLRDPGALASLRAQFRAIFIDEFQDTNRHQWSIFRALAAGEDGSLRDNRLFTVGDEKQAIYEFRGGEVEVCQIARQDMDPTLEFTANFRSAPNLLLFTNRFFEPLLTGGEAFEARAQPLRYRDKPTPPVDAEAPPAGGTVTRIVDADDAADTTEAGGASAVEREAQTIAELLRGIVAGEREDDYPGLATRIENGAPTVGVLFRRTTHQHAYEDALRTQGVPYIAAKGRGFYGREEIRDLRNLLRVLEDPGQDVPLVGVLRSPIVGCSDGGLLLLTARRRYRFQALWSVLGELGINHDADGGDPGFGPEDALALRKAAALLERWRSAARRSPIATVLAQTLAESGAYAPLALGVDGRQRVLNVEKFLGVVAAFEAEGARTLGDLNRYIDVQDAEGDAEGDADMPDGGAIQLLTVHRAKGLEWPMVIVPDTAARFRSGLEETDYRGGRSRGSRLAVGRMRDADGGDSMHVAMRYLTPRHEAVDTFAWTRLQQEHARRSRAEQKRLLYVAFTRAQEHLVIGTCADGARELRALDDGRSWMDWIETILADDPDYFGRQPFYAELPAASGDGRGERVTTTPEQSAVDTRRIWPAPGGSVGAFRSTDEPVVGFPHARLRLDLSPPGLDASTEAFNSIANALLPVAFETGADAEALARRAGVLARSQATAVDTAAATT
ncbi:UvrD-helicase domain-containing protein, partial [Candidatus Poribacteria bacterium]|nr:UvrD-helicase domain-containing protein [Candidatus Poribacteria bacterium]